MACKKGDACVCGGDLPEIRNGCYYWRASVMIDTSETMSGLSIEAPKTLRDEFAAAALAGMTIRLDTCNVTAEHYARHAYNIANAMMEIR